MEEFAYDISINVSIFKCFIGKQKYQKTRKW